MKQAIWTPWAVLLCYECHDRKAPAKSTGPMYVDPKPGDVIGKCDECGCSLACGQNTENAVADQVTILNALRQQLKGPLGNKLRHDTKLYLNQTGGMTCNAGIDIGDSKYMFGCDDDPFGQCCVGMVDCDDATNEEGVELPSHEGTLRSCIEWIERRS